MQKGQRLALAENVVDGLYALVIVVADGPELGVKVGQPHKKIVRVLVAHRNMQRSIEYPCADKVCRRAALSLAEHGKETLVFLAVQGYVVAVSARVGKNGVAGRISCQIALSHKHHRLRFDLGEPPPGLAPVRLRAGES